MEFLALTVTVCRRQCGATEAGTETENWERSSEVIKLATDYRVYWSSVAIVFMCRYCLWKVEDNEVDGDSILRLMMTTL